MLCYVAARVSFKTPMTLNVIANTGFRHILLNPLIYKTNWVHVSCSSTAPEIFRLKVLPIKDTTVLQNKKKLSNVKFTDFVNVFSLLFATDVHWYKFAVAYLYQHNFYVHLIRQFTRMVIMRSHYQLLKTKFHIFAETCFANSGRYHFAI